MKKINIPLPQIEGVELKNATVDLEKGVIVAEYGEEGQEDIEKDISEIAVGFASAVIYLDEDIHEPTFHTTKRHMTKLEAFNILITLAEAWNEFEPDWGDSNQDKYYPRFVFVSGKFEFWDTGVVGFILDPHLSNFSFKTPKRAEQFGKQFIDLFRIVLTN